jgi:hypothetical protein
MTDILERARGVKTIQDVHDVLETAFTVTRDPEVLLTVVEAMPTDLQGVPGARDAVIQELSVDQLERAGVLAAVTKQTKREAHEVLLNAAVDVLEAAYKQGGKNLDTRPAVKAILKTNTLEEAAWALCTAKIEPRIRHYAHTAIAMMGSFAQVALSGGAGGVDRARNAAIKTATEMCIDEGADENTIFHLADEIQATRTVKERFAAIGKLEPKHWIHFWFNLAGCEVLLVQMAMQDAQNTRPDRPAPAGPSGRRRPTG